MRTYSWSALFLVVSRMPNVAPATGCVMIKYLLKEGQKSKEISPRQSREMWQYCLLLKIISKGYQGEGRGRER